MMLTNEQLVIKYNRTPTEFARAKENFQKFDAHKDGKVTKDELKKGSEQAGVKCAFQQLEDWFKQADADGDGQITFEEYNLRFTVEVLFRNPEGIVTICFAVTN